MSQPVTLTTEELEDLFNRGALEFSKKPISDLNPNVTYGDIYNTDQLKLGALANSPLLQSYFSIAEGADTVKQKVDQYNQAVPSL